MTDLIIVGASGFGRELLSIIESINAIKQRWRILGFIDDNLNALDGFPLEYKVLGTIKEWQPIGEEQYALAIAAPLIKEKIVPLLKERGARFATIIDSTVAIGERTTVGEGVVMFGEVGISVDVTIGDYVFFNARDTVGHDAVIGDYCTLAPNVCISGKTRMGKCVNVGVLASTYPGITVGDYAMIGMNSCAIRNVKPGTTVIGVPAKLI